MSRRALDELVDSGVPLTRDAVAHVALAIAERRLIGTILSTTALAEYERAVEGPPAGSLPPATAAADDPRPRASSREPCSRCGVPGFRGCVHFAPVEPLTVTRRADGLEPMQRGQNKPRKRINPSKRYAPGKWS